MSRNLDYQKLSDIELFVQIKDDDAFAFQVLYNRYWPILWSVTVKATKNRETSKDIIQDVFADLWAKRHDIEIQYSVSSFVYRMTLNRVLYRLQRLKKEQAFYSQLAKYLGSTPDRNYTEEIVLKREEHKVFKEAVSFLPKKCRKIFELSREEDMKYREIADTLNISRETVKSQIKIALKSLRSKLTTILLLLL